MKPRSETTCRFFRWVLPALVVAAGLGLASAQPPAKPAQAAEKKEESQRLFDFEMRDKPWDKVLEWLSDQAGVPVNSSYKPSGTFNFIGTAKKTQYTLAEVIDHINEALLAQKYVLIRKPSSIMVLPADDPQSIDPSLIPPITVDELEADKPASHQKFGRTELARVVFSLQNLSGEDAKKDIEAVLGPFKKVTTISKGNKLLVTDTVGNLRRAKVLLDEIDGPAGSEFEVVSLGSLDGRAVLATLKANYGIGDTPKPNAPFLELDANRNVLTVRATPVQIQEIRAAVRKMGGSGAGIDGSGSGTERIRILTVEGRSPDGVIEALTHGWQDLRANPIEVVTQSQLMLRLEASKRQGADPGAPGASAPPGKSQLSDPQDRPKKGKANLPGDKNKPVLVAPLFKSSGGAATEGPPRNSIMVGSDDPEALVLVDEMVRYLTQPGDGEFVVIPLKHANAPEVAKVLDELFNGKRQQAAPSNPFEIMMGGRGRREEEPKTTSSLSRPIRVVADTRTNSLLVRAAQLELFKIRQLLEISLDVEGSDASALRRTYIVGPLKNATANEVAGVLREVYADFINRRQSQGGFNPFMPFPMRGGQQSEDQSAKATTLSIGVDDRTNSLIISCPEPMYQQIRELVDVLDKTAADNTRIVKTVRIDNVDPILMQQAIEAITGQRRDSRTGAGSRTSPFGQPGSSGDTDQRRDEFRNRIRSFLEGGSGGGRSGGGGDQNRGGGSRPNRGGGGTRPDAGEPGASVPGSPARGPGFFADGVKDDPSELRTVLYDPQQDRSFPTIVGEEQQPQPPGADTPGSPGQQPLAPRKPLTVEALPDIGQLVIIGDPADVEEVIKIIEQIKAIAKPAETEIRVFPLKKNDAVSVANTLTQVYQRIIVGPGSTTRPPAGQQLQQSSVIVLALPRQNAVLVGAPKGRMKDIEEAITKLDSLLSPDISVKTYQLRRASAAHAAATIQQFYAQRYAGEAANQNQVRVQADDTTNTVLVQASPADLEEIARLINFIDTNVTPAEVKVFALKKADATLMAQILQQLFLSGAATGGQRGGLGGQLGQLGQAGGQAGLGQQQPFGAQAGGQRPLSVGATTGDGVELRFAVDQRTNSLIIAGSRNDLVIAEAIILRLDSTDIRERINEVYKLKNTTAQDVANALSQFLQRDVQLLGQSGEATPFQQIEREVVVVPEFISNSLIISATPRFYDEVLKLIEKLDEAPPQVVIQVLIAEVRLEGSEEFGVEIGLQSPVLFNRGIIPAAGSFVNGANATVNYAAPATGPGLVPPGVTVNNSINPAAVPGFNFNNLGPLPNNPVISPGNVAPQGLTNFGLGRASTGGVGGFVFSASSDMFNLLIRALKTQGKIDVLSRPQITALDNQIASIRVGQQVPYVTTTNINVTGGINNTVNFRDVGIILTVTPKISPDGHVVMRVEPEVSSLSQSTVNLGNNVFAPVFNQTLASTTVSAMDGQTVVIGGLITRRDEKQERKVPWLGDLPYVGAGFRFRMQNKLKTELLIILTPRVVRGGTAEAERIMAEEARKMDWFLSDVEEIHGPLGLEPDTDEPPFADCHPAVPLEVGQPAIPLTPGLPSVPQQSEQTPMPNTVQPMSYRPMQPAALPPASRAPSATYPSWPATAPLQPIRGQPPPLATRRMPTPQRLPPAHSN